MRAGAESRPRRSRVAPAARERGQASVELVAVVPLLLLVALAFAQLLVVGYALWSAGDAARAGARAALVGGDPERVAERAVPGPFRARVRVRDARVRVELAAPALVPGLPAMPVSASSELPGAKA